ncbi:hypothetical protein STRDD11_00987 [Streptococcus sp. DD11]|nr:hypothetical protein STRDD11_00987 [Streptococcus sp. DD11]
MRKRILCSISVILIEKPVKYLKSSAFSAVPNPWPDFTA